MSIEGQSYIPSNGTEGMFFMAEFCDRCKHNNYDRGCPILMKTMYLVPGDKDYPPEWVYGKDTLPTCTAFEAV